MKKIKYIALISVFSLGITSCGDFGDLDIDPGHLNEVNVPSRMVFSSTQHQALESSWGIWRTGRIYSAQQTQQLTSIDRWNGYSWCNCSDGYSASSWDTFGDDRGVTRGVTTRYDKWKDQKGLEIGRNTARATRIYAFAEMPDLYGDTPYAKIGRPKESPYPKHDSQESMYEEMLKELDEAQAKLASGKAAMGVQDLYYKGDVVQWEKLANLLMLHPAMRLVKVDPTTAETYASRAYANGIITDVTDNIKLDHAGGVTTNDSPESFTKINAGESREFFLSKVFVDILEQTNNPRLLFIRTTVSKKDLISVQDGWQGDDFGDMVAGKQKGIPSGGYSLNPTGSYIIAKVDPRFGRTPENTMKYKERKTDDGSVKKEPVYWYSRHTRYFPISNRYTYGGPTASTFIIATIQTSFLLAEAAIRGYISGDAKTFYESGARAALKQFVQPPDAGKVYGKHLPKGAIEKYFKKNLFDAAKASRQTDIRHYITVFGDPHEAFASRHRSGFLVLIPVAMAKQDRQHTTDGSIPRRFRYSPSESWANRTGYDAAVSRQGGDTFSIQMWWDR